MPAKAKYEIIRAAVLSDLKKNLPSDLWYHSVEHTADVEVQAIRIAAAENISSPQELLLLKVACLYHDTGFLFTYKEHELAGCKFAAEELPFFGFTADEINIVKGMIMATKIPQTPLTKLEEIICDADLDYLGREDFLPVSNHLFLELQARNLVTTEHAWNNIQLAFFEQHRYFTTTTKQLREEQKRKHRQLIEAAIIQ